MYIILYKETCSITR